MDTKIFKIDDSNLSLYESELSDASDIIRHGGLVVFPTETVYGLGADGTDADACRRIYAAKGRPSDNPLIIHIALPTDAEDYVYTSELYYRLAERFMPGPLTVIMRAKDSVPEATRAGLPTVAVRCPENVIARRLIELSGVPIAAPSANLSGSPSPTSGEHVIADMKGRVDIIIDGGECTFGLESTIVKIEDDGTLTLLRPGKITPEELSEFADVNIASSVTAALRDGERVLSPGMKYKHYAPKSPVALLSGDIDAVRAFLTDEVKRASIAYISYTEDITALSEIEDLKLYDLGAREDAIAQSHNLFSVLRKTDEGGFDCVYAPKPKTEGVYLALYNRLIRAAAHRIIDLKEV